ncbi:hypothetical protein ADL00_23815 [Streptomyces sp. AS58]|uniref:hypothetical protein n=1 Tax=Streptomyces sp. AS58 TaxID=1519489 RepID=UPI0006AF14FC|nr:hypothetical protein [Streptomyces sp. AS58]KOV62974.1 hypothetical protein ADL00_23815 [Streptomyces sp. AS58]
MISLRRIGGRFDRGVPAPFTVLLITLEVFATGQFRIWEPVVNTRTHDVGVRRFTGILHASTRDRHLAVAAFHQVSAFRRLAEGIKGADMVVTRQALKHAKGAVPEGTPLEQDDVRPAA